MTKKEQVTNSSDCPSLTCSYEGVLNVDHGTCFAIVVTVVYLSLSSLAVSVVFKTYRSHV